MGFFCFRQIFIDIGRERVVRDTKTFSFSKKAYGTKKNKNLTPHTFLFFLLIFFTLALYRHAIVLGLKIYTRSAEDFFFGTFFCAVYALELSRLMAMAASAHTQEIMSLKLLVYDALSY